MRKTLWALAIVVLVAPWCSAQGSANAVELTPTVGYWFGDTLATGWGTGYDFPVEVDDATAFGLRLGYRFHPNWALEWSLHHENADLVSGGSGGTIPASTIGDIDLDTLEIGFEGSFGHSRFVPFLAGGIGLMHMDPSLPGLGTDTRFVGNFGPGFKIFFTPDFAFRFDWRVHSVSMDGGHDDCDWWDDCDWDYDDNWTTFNEVSMGLTFAF
jgi:hypothetical protein